MTHLTRNFLLCTVVLSISTVYATAQETHRYRTPFSYQFTIGGMEPARNPQSDSPSLLIGGGVSLPASRWFSLDLGSMEFGFGTTNQTQTILVSDGSTRTTKNYQMMLSSGAHVNLPIYHKLVLGLGGGYSGVFQNEYVPTSVSTVGGTTVFTDVNCTTCTRNAFAGPYAEARISARSNKYAALGIDAKYYFLHDSSHNPGDVNWLQPQQWLTVGFILNFGI